MLNAMELIELMEQLERIEGVRWLGSIENTIDLIFFKAFGIDWNKNLIYKELRKFASKGMILTKNQDNICYLISF